MKHHVFALAVVSAALLAVGETQIVRSGKTSHAVNRSIFGVNQLSYGKWSYEFTAPNGKVNPEMTTILKDIGVKAMRYPGGCGGTHSYNWKVSAGLVPGKRYSLQLMEFLKCCEEIGAEPILGLSGLRGTPEEAAEFVEFLNSPNDGTHPMAAERARLGHPAPYRVRLVEYGNETYDNGHKKADSAKPMNGKVYAANYLAFRDAMKKVDPSIQLGVVTLGDAGNYWDGAIHAACGNNIDFLIIHTYAGAAPVPPKDFPRLFSRQEAITSRIAKARERFGRADLPVVITEFNTNFATHKTLAAALVNAEALMAFAADPGVLHADYWQFVNEGFGMVRGKPGTYVLRPNALAFRVFTRHTLDKLIPCTVKQNLTATDTGMKLTQEEKDREYFGLKKRRWFTHKDSRFRFKQHPDDTMEAEFLTDEEMNFFHASVKIGEIEPGNDYDWKLEAEISVQGMQNTSGFALQFGDGRGWNATRSSVSTPTTLAADWIPVECVYTPLADTKSLSIQLRRVAGGGKGIARVRNVRIHRIERGAVERPTIGAQLTASADGKTRALVLVNRTCESEDIVFGVPDAEKCAIEAETLTAPSPWTNNEESADAVKIVPLQFKREGKAIRLTLPPHSLAGVKCQAE